jgi:predicted RNA-binding protein associated with RNAse of E/G family
MATLYSEIDKSDWYYQPNFVRFRHRYRGVRESYKINTEITQYYYDIRKIFNESESIRDDLDTYSDIILNGGTIDGCVYYEVLSATPIESNLELIGLSELAIRTEKLRNRTKILERNQ